MRQEAAAWFALMRGPDAAMRRCDFEAWLAADARHRRAYNRIGETFSLGKTLKDLPAQDGRSEPPVTSDMAASALPKRARGAGFLVASVVMALLVVAATTIGLRSLGSSSPLLVGSRSRESRELVTGRGEVRTYTLADRSQVTLDSDTRVSVAMSSHRRSLRLVQGRARFVVAHDPRAFVVSAARGFVIARGTVFDVSLRSDVGAIVNLIEGTIDVGRYEDSGIAPRSSVRLAAGRSVAFGGARHKAELVSSVGTDWPEAIRDFDAMALGDLVAEANRYAAKPLRLESGDLANLRVSGAFRVRDTRRLAANLSELLGLTMREERDRIVLARRCADNLQQICSSVS